MTYLEKDGPGYGDGLPKTVFVETEEMEMEYPKPFLQKQKKWNTKDRLCGNG